MEIPTIEEKTKKSLNMERSEAVGLSTLQYQLGQISSKLKNFQVGSEQWRYTILIMCLNLIFDREDLGGRGCVGTGEARRPLLNNKAIKQ